jgi:hypothetical protein
MMKTIDTRIEHFNDGATIHFFRKGKKMRKLRLGPNHVHAFITHPDGSITDLGISENLLTNGGRDLWAATFGNATLHAGTHTTAPTTLVTDSALAGSASLYNGWRLYSPITGLTTPLVYANCATGGSSTTIVIDQWWTATDTTGTTPAINSVYLLVPMCAGRFMAVSGNTTAPTASDTTLAGEETGGVGLNRTKATYAHTGGNATYTEQVAYSVTGTPATNPIHKMALFTAANPTAGGIMVFATILNADATVGNGDTLTVTDTITMSG